MNSKMKLWILIFLALLTAFDTFTTFVGTLTILGNNIGSTDVMVLLDKSQTYAIVISSIFAFGIGSMLLATVSIFEYSKYNSEIFAKFLPLVWFVFFGYDVFTSWRGNLNLMYGNSIALTSDQLAILAPVTIFVSISAIIISYALKE